MPQAIHAAPAATPNSRKAWQPYEGPRGGAGWKNSETGRVVYQDEKPGDSESAPQVESFEEFSKRRLTDLKSEVSDWRDSIRESAREYAEAENLSPEEAKDILERVSWTYDPSRNRIVDDVPTKGLMQREFAALAFDDSPLDEVVSQRYKYELRKLAEEYERSVDEAQREFERNEALDWARDVWGRVQSEGERTYVRYGDIPESGRSFNYRDGVSEAGVSTYPAWKLPDGQIVLDFTEGLGGSWTFIAPGRPLYEVSGSVLDAQGSDGEPLIENASIVRQVDDDSVLGALMFSKEELESE